MRTTDPTLAAFMIAALMSQSAIATEVYKWTDADGGVHYGQHRPTDVTAMHATLHHGDETDAEAKAKLDQLMEKAGFERGAVKAAEAKAERADSAVTEQERERACTTARHTLAKLGNWAKHLLATDSSGTVTTVDSDQRSAAIARVRQWMADNKCQ